MDKALEQSLAAKPFIKGMLCADMNGLLITAKGEIDGSDAGRYSSISRQASSLHPDQAPPTVLIETNDRNILVKDYDSKTIVLRCQLSKEQ
mmetsp:Transcript_12629/g.12265  ORF Transcript_12629/g.12265 Transcript_12629/m.12265 type:complete len:91 (+) Transcript_12629:179-451(+)